MTMLAKAAMPSETSAPEKVDVVVVGAGAAGSLLAAKLAEGGKSVVLLEGGPARTLDDLYSNQIWARRLKWYGPPAESGGDAPIGVNFNLGWGTGGAALHHYAVWLRLHEEDFALASNFGVGLDWPISYEDLRPYYDRVQAEVGLSGDAAAEVWRPTGDPYPMPPLDRFKQGELIARGFTKLGLRTSPLPLAITSREYDGRPACIYDGWCDAGCPIGALANPLVVYLPRALAAGAVVRNESYVTRVLTDPNGTRAIGVEYADADGERRTQEADVVILAAFAIQNPRILLTSATEEHPDGLANSSGLVGAYMMSHAARFIYGLFDEETENYLGVSGGQLLCQADYAKDPAKGYVASYSWLIGNALKPNDLLGIANSRPDIFGQALHDFMADAARHLATMIYVGENRPLPENRLTLGDRTDRFGVPIARIAHAFHADDLKAFEAGTEQGTAVFQAAGAREVWPGGMATIHIMGGAIMGDDPTTSVTNSYGQTHDLANLFVLGSSLFPTSGAVNPTFTIHALTLRSADYVLANWSTFT